MKRGIRPEESLAMFGLVLDTIPARVFWKDRDSVFLGCNKLFAEDAGKSSPDEMIGTTDRDHAWADLAEAYVRDDREVMESGVPKLHYVEPQTAPDGRKVWLRTSKIPLRDARGEVVGILGTYEEITEAHEAEEKLRKAAEEMAAKNAELARASHLKDEFLATMSHELRTPLSAILGLADALGEEVYGTLNERQLRALLNVRESGRHLLDLINDLLDLSRIEFGEMALQLETVAVEAACEACLQMVTRAAGKKKVKLSLEVEEGVRTISADARRLRQILVNLLSNAVKFTPEGGEAGLRVRGDAARGTIVFTVWDHGSGIPREDLPLLFQPFVQLDRRLAAGQGGTGLGLALVRKMADLHGGSVQVESEVGKGSTFTVELPAGVRPEASPRAAGTRERGAVPLSRRRARSGAPPVVLVVEDEPSLSTLLVEYLESRGYAALPAFDGLDALEVLREARPAAVLMDIQLPRMDGLETTRWMRRQPEFAKTPVIALTALAMPGDRERCLAAGADVYLPKPIHLADLTAVLDERICSSA